MLTTLGPGTRTLSDPGRPPSDKLGSIWEKPKTPEAVHGRARWSLCPPGARLQSLALEA